MIKRAEDAHHIRVITRRDPRHRQHGETNGKIVREEAEVPRMLTAAGSSWFWV